MKIRVWGLSTVTFFCDDSMISLNFPRGGKLKILKHERSARISAFSLTRLYLCNLRFYENYFDG